MHLYVSFLLFALFVPVFGSTPAEAQSGDVDCLAIVDAEGTRVARVILDVHAVQFFYKEHDGFAVPLTLSQQAIRGTLSRIWFTDDNCSSTPFTEIQITQPMATSVLIGQEVYYAEPFAITQEIQALSYLSDQEECQSPDPTPSAVVATPITHQFTLPQYMPPFTVEPETCAAAPEPDPEQVVNGCVKDANGTLRIVADPTDCNARETPITWLRQ